MLPSNIFYNHFSREYNNYSKTRKDYINSVDGLILKTNFHPKNIIDLGAGTGTRARKISTEMNIENVTLVDNSPRMLEEFKSDRNFKIVVADIAGNEFINEKYDAALCLWNVMGHVDSEVKRMSVIQNISDILNVGGYAFIDVNNRYNISQYGFKNVLRNMFADFFGNKDKIGNYPLKIKRDKIDIETVVHIFNPSEVDKLIKIARLSIVEKRYVNYDTGRVSRNPFVGQIFYKIQKK